MCVSVSFVVTCDLARVWCVHFIDWSCRFHVLVSVWFADSDQLEEALGSVETSNSHSQEQTRNLQGWRPGFFAGGSLETHKPWQHFSDSDDGRKERVRDIQSGWRPNICVFSTGWFGWLDAWPGHASAGKGSSYWEGKVFFWGLVNQGK